MTTPVVLLHGWGGSFDATWARTGFAALLEDAGRPVVGIDLLGHGTAPKPHDPAAYADLTGRVLDALPAEPVDAIGFSLGAITLLRTALARPGAFRRLVVAGIGDGVIGADSAERQSAASETQRRIVQALESDEPAEDNHARLFVRYAERPGNDRAALTAIMKRPRAHAITADSLAGIPCPTLVVIGDRDGAGPADALAAAFQMGHLTVLRNTDHFATPESFGFVEAALEFIGAAP